MRQYRLGAHTKSDLKVHVVWIPKYRKKILEGEIARRLRDLLRQIAMENDVLIISGKIAKDYIHMFISYRPHQAVSRVVQKLKGVSSRASFMGEGLLGSEFREYNG